MSDTDLPHAANLRWGRFSEPGRAYHITKCCHLYATVSLTSARVAPVLINGIRWHKEQGHAHLLAFVIMPDHLHWLFVLGETRKLRQVLHGLCSYSWRRVVEACHPPQPTFWQEEYYDHSLRSEERVWDTMEYIHENPVRKGLCDVAEEWPWSTWNTQFRGWIEEEYLR